MIIDFASLVCAIISCVLFCLMKNWHAAVWSVIAAIAYIRLIGNKKNDQH